MPKRHGLTVHGLGREQPQLLSSPGVEDVLRSPYTVRWDAAQRQMLQQVARSRTAPLRRIQRALACADGQSNAAIARELGVHVATMRRSRKRFHLEGMAALEDRKRPGRPRLARRLLRRGEFASRQELIDKIHEFTLAHDDQARLFRWTYDGTPLRVESRVWDWTVRLGCGLPVRSGRCR